MQIRWFRRIPRQRRLVSFGGHTAPPTSLAPSEGPKPHLAISFTCLPPVSGSDWALCWTRKVLASLCLNSVPLKRMENVLIPPFCLSVSSSSEWGIPELWLTGNVWMSCIGISYFPHAKVWALFSSCVDRRQQGWFEGQFESDTFWKLCLCFASVHQFYVFAPPPHSGSCSPSPSSVVVSALFWT